MLKNPGFDISMTFHQIDVTKKGYITASDVSFNYLNYNIIILDRDIFKQKQNKYISLARTTDF